MPELTITCPVHFKTGRAGLKRLRPGEAPVQPADKVPPGRVPRLSRLMALAIHFEGLLDRGEVKDMAELARLGHVTRARVTQIMNLRLLAPDIQEALLFLPRVHHGRDPLLYRHIQPLTTTASWREQRERWKSLKQGNDKGF